MGSASVPHSPACNPFGCCVLGLEAHRFDSCHGWRAVAVIPWNPKRQKNRSCLPPTWRHARSWANGVGSNGSDGSRFSLLPSTTSSPLRLVHYCSASCFDLHRYHHRRAASSTRGASRSHSLAQTCFSSYMGGALSCEMPSLLVQYAFPDQTNQYQRHLKRNDH